jgi:hypothetical protein
MSNINTPFIELPRTSNGYQRVERQGEEPLPEDRAGGIIQGKDATEPEMIWARELQRAGKDFIFQFEVPTAYTLPGQGKQIDFIVDGQYADEIDGEIAHKTAGQKQEDFERDTQLEPMLRALGLNGIRRIDAEQFTNPVRVRNLIREYYL